MGQGRRLIETPDGQVLNQVQYDQYMHDVYNPQQDFLGSENMTIPGIGGVPYAPGTTNGGLLGSQVPVPRGGPQQQIPYVMPPAAGPPVSGPYGQQAMRMAGLLSGPQAPPPGGGGNGLLGGGRIGFRIPYGGK